MDHKAVESPAELEDPTWFREPSRREQWIGASLFIGFGLFFVLLFVLQRGWWFSWVILGLGMISLIRGFYHAVRGLQASGKH